jgi:hypothetical protein
MDLLTIILLILIVVFVIGNYLLSHLIKKYKQKNIFPENHIEAKIKVLKSKVDVLHNRLSRIEGRK